MTEPNNPRPEVNNTSCPDPAQIREQATQKAKAINLPDLSTMTSEEIRGMIYEMQVKKIEADLQIKHLRSGLEEAEFVASNQSHKIEYRYRCEDGSYLWLETVGQFNTDEGIPQIIIFTSRDITKRKHAEKSLRKSEERYRTILNEMSEGYQEVDLSGNFTFFNEAFLSIFGYSRDEMMGTNFKHYAAEEAIAKKVYRLYNEMYKTGAPIQNSEWDIIRKDGERRTLEYYASVVKDSEDSPTGFRGIVRDITDRKKAEKQMRLQSLVLDQIEDRVTVTDFDGIITYVNEAEVRALGYSREEILGASTEKFGDNPNRGATQQEILEETLNHGTWRGEVINRTIDGQEIILNCRTQVVLDDQGDRIALAGIATDITKRKQTEDLLRASEEKYRSILDKIEDGYFEVNLAGNFTFFNGSMCRILGYSSNELIGMNNRVFMDTENADKVYKAFNQVFTSGKPLKAFDWELIKKVGEKCYVDTSVSLIKEDNGEAIGFRGIARDITDRKQAREALRESEERYFSIITVSNTGAWEYNRETDFLWCSPEYFTMIGHNPADYPMTGQSNLQHVWIDFLHPEDRDRAAGFFADYLNTGSKGMYEQHFRMRHKDGHWVWIWSRGKTLCAQDGALTNLTLGTHINISEIERAEKEKEKLQSQLNQAQKMESVGRLAGGVAHDFNNKLTIINSYAEMAIDMLVPSDPLHEMIQEIQTAGKQSADIVRQLLAFARKQIISPKLLDLNDTISPMLKTLQRLIGENIDLAWHPGKNLWPVIIDPSQVDQIMANLAANARDAISDVGKLTVESKNTVIDEDYCKTNPDAMPGRYVMLAISDDGCGMEKDVMDQLFEPFFTTKEVGKGTGLGLPTIFGIIKQNKGFLNVYSEPGKGTTFKLYFPSCDTEKPSVLAAKKFRRNLPGGKETILVVEDEKALLQASRRILDRLGYTLLIAENPREALQLGKEYNETIHLLITDVVMPEMNGRELSSQMTMSRPGLKTLYMSGYTANAIAHHGVLDEGVLFIQKPFSMQGLAAKVREAIEQ